MARRIAVARLPAFAVVVKTNDRYAVGGANFIHWWVGVECQTFEHPERVGLDLRAFVGVDREEMRVRPDARRAEEAAGDEPARIADRTHLEVVVRTRPSRHDRARIEHRRFLRFRGEEIVIERRIVVLDGDALIRGGR